MDMGRVLGDKKIQVKEVTVLPKRHASTRDELNVGLVGVGDDANTPPLRPTKRQQ